MRSSMKALTGPGTLVTRRRVKPQSCSHRATCTRRADRVRNSSRRTRANPVWATQVSGVDPGAMAPPPSGRTGQVAGTAARGAAVGAVGGAIGGNAGKGAAIGAATGALSAVSGAPTSGARPSSRRRSERCLWQCQCGLSRRPWLHGEVGDEENVMRRLIAIGNTGRLGCPAIRGSRGAAGRLGAHALCLELRGRVRPQGRLRAQLRGRAGIPAFIRVMSRSACSARSTVRAPRPS